MIKNYIKNNKNNFILLGSIILVILLSITSIFLFKKNENKTDENILYDIKLNGYELDKDFNIDTYEYNVTVYQDDIYVDCSSNIDIDGCNENISLKNIESYVHIIEFNNKKYTINIKKINSSNVSELLITTIEGIPNSWINNDIYITINSNSNEKLYYSKDNGNTYQDENKFVITENGEYNFIVKDKNNNLSKVRTIKIDKIDKDIPKILISKELSNNKVVINISVFDETSKIIGTSINGSEYKEKYTYEITKSGTYTFSAKDEANNISNVETIVITNDDLKTSTKDNTKENAKEKVESKTYTATFNSNGAIVYNNTLSCTTTTSSCKIIAPNITSNKDILGWSTNKNSTTSEINQSTSLSLNSNKTYYAITKKTYTATFDLNGATSVSKSSISCSVYNNNTSCNITTPTITKSGSTIVGWNTNKNATTSEINQSTSLSLNSNKTYYAITKKTYTATFDSSELDYIEYKSTSCDCYNNDSTCNIKLPNYYKYGSYDLFWYPSKLGDLKSANAKWEWKYWDYKKENNITINSNITFYPNFNGFHFDLSVNYSKYRNINISSNFKIGSALYVVESGVPNTAINTFKSNLNIAYNKIPWLFTEGKNFIFTESTYNNYSTAYGLTQASAQIGYNYIIDLKYDTTGIASEGIAKNSISINAALHELAHAWDYKYEYKYGSTLSSSSDFNTVYNYFKNNNKLYIDGSSYISKTEFFAASVTNYYWHVLGIDTSKPLYGLKTGVKLTSDDKKVIQNFIDKYKNK